MSSTGNAQYLSRADRHPLDPIFSPASVALVGASERPASVGRTVLWNLISNPFGGTIYPVNPKRAHVLGIRAYASLQSLPEVPDLVIVCIAAERVPAIMRECVQLGVPAAIIISAGFKETGEHGKQLEAQILQAVQGSMRVVGPNSVGVMNPVLGLNATFSNSMARPGNVAFISQSGALCTAILDWANRENVGFSGFVSVGSMMDVNWGDLIDYFGNDPRTRSIVIYMESVGDASYFLSAAREVSLSKPIIVIKPGRTAAAAKAAASHTGSLTGSDAVLDAAFRRTGVLRVNSIAEVFFMTEVLAKQPRPKGNRLCIVTNAGGPGVLATDALIHGGGQIAELSPETIAAFNAILPAAWSHSNPVDILGDADPIRYAKAIEIAARDSNIDGILVITTPQGLTNPTLIAEELKPYARGLGKPLLASWMGGPSVAAGEEILNRAGIPSFYYPDIAARLFNYMWRYSYNLRALYETPALTNAAMVHPNRARASQILSTVRNRGRIMLTEHESKKLLESYGIPCVRTEVAATEEAAVFTAATIGYPVVLKLNSFTISHKAAVGGVVLNVADAAGVRRAFGQIRDSVEAKVGPGHFQGVTVQPFAVEQGYELILGASLDPQFGPVLLFGTGGRLVEVFEDRALALPPLNTTLARRMMEQTRIYKALKGERGHAAVDLCALEELLVRFSDLIIDNPAIEEIDINPVLASADRFVALDARVMVHDQSVADDQLPRSAIRPYPARYVSEWTMKNGEPVTIRPVRPEDEPLMIDFHKKLSDRSVYLRYFQALKLTQRTAHERLTRICFIDYDREMALVAECKKPDGTAEIAAVGRLSKIHGRPQAELAAIVQDQFHGKGLGIEICRRLIQVARDQHLTEVQANMLGENREMQNLLKKLGFRLTTDIEDNLVLGILVL